MLQSSYALWIGGIVVGMLIFALALLWLIGIAGASGEETPAERASRETEHTTDATSIDELRSEAESFRETAVDARANNDFDESIDAYGAAVARYQAILDELDTGAAESREEIEQSFDATREELETVRTLNDHRQELLETLKTAEQSFQVAIVAYTEGSQTLARIRFRQARDSFESALDLVEGSDEDLLSPPVKVSVEPDRTLPSTMLGELPAVPEPATASLADAEVETVTELESSEEPPWPPAVVETLVAEEDLDDEVATTLTLLSWVDGADTHEFGATTTVSQRHEQAVHGFTQSS
ncbi:hypothetical protein PN419_09295 [Halorubrum ezzemoulense]|jgi:hypothetical protein|uniref:hypothetical protein n=1 Tax=Halorubrum ezzemoulense TaxID=337243 RepID=UPI00232C87D7|nr:hypothetical protein [Halorubrum ezzemoulense]MDB9249185.1 hypothetical protein [Halorubrum ezzemoulense]MDB9259659.1 hypothetical protein [Halorubrum ezzemoulense]MDB9263124.1 hypothetical protein [Halorubrum ezzemoulense]MDB9266446.1 hypothetical protein [Halorubrum ezzemoulense]MDB9270020.1 hypothetical protein [Halorubrum ezzemoulense]